MCKSNASALCIIALLLLSLSATGCSALSPSETPTVPPDVPMARAPLPSAKLMTRPRPEDYSERAQADIAQWRKPLESLPAK